VTLLQLAGARGAMRPDGNHYRTDSRCIMLTWQGTMVANCMGVAKACGHMHPRSVALCHAQRKAALSRIKFTCHTVHVTMHVTHIP
jgi:hypothetical protein